MNQNEIFKFIQVNVNEKDEKETLESLLNKLRILELEYQNNVNNKINSYNYKLDKSFLEIELYTEEFIANNRRTRIIKKYSEIIGIKEIKLEEYINKIKYFDLDVD